MMDVEVSNTHQQPVDMHQAESEKCVNENIAETVLTSSILVPELHNVSELDIQDSDASSTTPSEESHLPIFSENQAHESCLADSDIASSMISLESMVTHASLNDNVNAEYNNEDSEDYHSASDGEYEEEKTKIDEKNLIDDEDYRRKVEEALSVEERLERQERGQKLKDEGNTFFRQGTYKEAIILYTQALQICPLNFHKERAVMFSNRAACRMKEESYEEGIKDCTKAIELHPQYLKAILRRAELYEQTEKLDEALKDHQRVLELDPGQHASRAACMRLPEQIKDRNEKLKNEMLGKLKELGNMVLRPFGMSTDNFKLQQDPASGSYNVQFVQNPSTNGK